MSVRGCYGERATRARLRSACCPYSTVDVDAHVKHVVRTVLAGREQKRIEQLDDKLRKLKR